jgi:hypothetical protein
VTAAEQSAGTPVAPWAAAGVPPAATSSPVVVLTYAQAGARWLDAVLSAYPTLACTSGTGLLAACDQAAAAWRNAEGRRPDLPLSRLAAASIRSLAAALLTAILAPTGRSRWCETTIVQPGAAATFLELFPGTRFVCLHRSCPDVIYSIIQNSPWGLSRADFADFIEAHPGSTVAALAAYWTAHARRLLSFEEVHQRECLRVRYEDLVSDPEETTSILRDFLGLDRHVLRLPKPPNEELADGHISASADDSASGPGLTDADKPGCGAGVPVGQIPERLLSQVNEVLTMLDYEPLGPGP